MSGTVFVDGAALDAAAAESEAGGAADAVVGVAALALAAAAAAVGDALAVGAAEFDVEELAGAPVPVDVPDGVHDGAQAATMARSERPEERGMFMGRGAWDDTTAAGVKENRGHVARPARSVTPWMHIRVAASSERHGSAPHRTNCRSETTANGDAIMVARQ